MTTSEAKEIFDSKGEEYFSKLLDYVIVKRDNDKAVTFFMEATGCDEELAYSKRIIKLIDDCGTIQKVVCLANVSGVFC